MHHERATLVVYGMLQVSPRSRGVNTRNQTGSPAGACDLRVPRHGVAADRH